MFTNARQARMEPYGLSIPAGDDLEFDDWVLTTVKSGESGWEVSGGTWTAHMPKLDEREVEPKIGDTLRVYGGIGREIQGMVLNGTVIWYRTPAQREAKRRRWREDYQAQNERRSILSAGWREETYQSLHPTLRARMDRLRATKEGTDETPSSWENYELFILQQATILAAYFTSTAQVRQYQEKSFEAQKAVNIEGMDLDAHSGNTFGMACVFAQKLIMEETDL